MFAPEFLEEIRQRKHEMAIHDLNHDGHLYKSKASSSWRGPRKSMHTAENLRRKDFVRAVLYRKQVWYDELKFAYDMSVPNVAHLDPQRGGCCTVMPYFIGDILEIPVTTIQDYTLFNILSDFSTRIWKQQTEIIAGKYGLMSFIVHPDYVIEARTRAIYQELLRHLVDLRERRVCLGDDSRRSESMVEAKSTDAARLDSRRLGDREFERWSGTDCLCKS